MSCRPSLFSFNFVSKFCMFYYFGCNYKYLASKKWKIHTRKPEVLIITNRNFVGPLLPVRIGYEVLQIIRSTSLHGIEVDNKMTWNTQLKKVIKSYSGKVGATKKNGILANTCSRRNLFQNNHCCNKIWYDCVVD